MELPKIVFGIWIVAGISLIFSIPAILIEIRIFKTLRCMDSLMNALPITIILCLLTGILVTVWESLCFVPGDYQCVAENENLYVFLVLNPLLFNGCSDVINFFIWLNFVLGSRALFSHTLESFHLVRKQLICLVFLSIAVLVVFPFAYLQVEISHGSSFRIFNIYTIIFNYLMWAAHLVVGLTLLRLLKEHFRVFYMRRRLHLVATIAVLVSAYFIRATVYMFFVVLDVRRRFVRS